MNEAEWLTCTDPAPMLAFLRASGRASERKLRLFAVACCRRVWHLIGKPGRKAVEAIEEYAEGLIGPEELDQANRRATGDLGRDWRRHTPLVTYAVNCAAARDIDAVGVAYYVARTLAELELEDSRLRARASSGRSGFGKGHKDRARRALKRQLRTEEAHEDIAWSERQAQAALVRELFGPAGAVTIPSSVLAWDDGTVRRIAQALHEEQRVGDLPILADALEEAGCTDGAILAHCRGPGPHVRDCWVVDLILAKP